MRPINALIITLLLAALAVCGICGCGHDSSASAYGNLPIDHPGPSNAMARSVPTLSPAQRQQVMIRKFGADAADQPPSGSK